MKVGCAVASFYRDKTNKGNTSWTCFDNYREDIKEQFLKNEKFEVKHELFIYIHKKKMDPIESVRLASVPVERFTTNNKIFHIAFDKVSYSYFSNKDIILCNSLIQKI